MSSCQRSCGATTIGQVVDAAKGLEGKFTAWVQAAGKDSSLPSEAVVDWLSRAGLQGLSEADLKATVDKIGSKVNLDQLNTLISDLATRSNVAVKDLKDKLAKVEPPK